MVNEGRTAVRLRKFQRLAGATGVTDDPATEDDMPKMPLRCTCTSGSGGGGAASACAITVTVHSIILHDRLPRVPPMTRAN
jgi:hypothetical protein